MIKLFLLINLALNNIDDTCNDKILQHQILSTKYEIECKDINDNKTKYCKSIAMKIIEIEDYLKKECKYEYTKTC